MCLSNTDADNLISMSPDLFAPFLFSNEPMVICPISESTKYISVTLIPVSSANTTSSFFKDNRLSVS